MCVGVCMCVCIYIKHYYYYYHHHHHHHYYYYYYYYSDYLTPVKCQIKVLACAHMENTCTCTSINAVTGLY